MDEENDNLDRIELEKKFQKVLDDAFKEFERQHRNLQQLYRARKEAIESERKGVVKTVRELSGVPENYVLSEDEESGSFHFRKESSNEKEHTGLPKDTDEDTK